MELQPAPDGLTGRPPCPIPRAMRANYKMQRLFVPDDLAAGQPLSSASPRAEPLSRPCAAHGRGRRDAACLQRPRRRVAGARRGQDQEGGAAGAVGADAAAAADARPRLLLCAAEAGPARLSRAEGRRDGRRRAAAGHHPAHAGGEARHRAAARQCGRGGRAMRHPRGAARCASRRNSTGCWPAGTRTAG